MADDVQKAQEDVQFPLNKRLLEESARIKEERKTVRERLEKIEKSKSEVSEIVYEKVKSDYQNQLNQNTDKLLEKKQDIDRELATLYEAKKKVQQNVNTHREKLEEINFRHDLGEYKGDDYHKLADEENEKLGKFEKILSAIESNIKQYETLFEGEEELTGSKVEIEEAPPPPPPPAAKPEPEQKEKPIITEEEEYQVGEEGYFSAETDEIHLKQHTEETNKEVTPISEEVVEEKVEEEPEAAAKLMIIEGYGKGDEFEITKDEITIGRAGGNDVALKEAKVSRQHASIKKQGKEYLITDLHSSNGVFVNDEKVQEHALNDGDEIRIGDFALKFTCA